MRFFAVLDVSKAAFANPKPNPEQYLVTYPTEENQARSDAQFWKEQLEIAQEPTLYECFLNDEDFETFKKPMGTFTYQPNLNALL